MLVCKIELWPGGDQSKAKQLGLVEIINDATGTVNNGNYKVELLNFTGKSIWKQAKLINFPRKLLGSYDLLYRALRETVGYRNPE